MHRAFRFLSVIVLTAYLTGCSSDTSSNPPTKTPEEVKQQASQMPPMPGAKTAKPGTHK